MATCRSSSSGLHWIRTGTRTRIGTRTLFGLLVQHVLHRLLLAAEAGDLERRLLLEDVLPIQLGHLLVLGCERAGLLPLRAQLLFARVLGHAELVEVGL